MLIQALRWKILRCNNTFSNGKVCHHYWFERMFLSNWLSSWTTWVLSYFVVCGRQQQLWIGNLVFADHVRGMASSPLIATRCIRIQQIATENRAHASTLIAQWLCESGDILWINCRACVSWKYPGGVPDYPWLRCDLVCVLWRLRTSVRSCHIFGKCKLHVIHTC